MTHSERLTIRIIEVVSKLPAEVRRRHAQYILSSQANDGGFPGRRGASDVYYTSFAARMLTVLDAWNDDAIGRAGDYLALAWERLHTLIDYTSWLTTAASLRIAGYHGSLIAEPTVERTICGLLNELRRDDGGFAKVIGSGLSSTYHTYLAVLCAELLGLELPEPGPLTRMLRARHQSDGGFSELPMLRSSGTNTTAAAVGIMEAAELQWQPYVVPVTRFLCGMQTYGGGCLAAARAPMPDLLSTCTALLTLDRLDALDACDIEAAREFVRRLEVSDGGFLGTEADEMPDVEYTFYGLVASGLTAS
ncbi:terpene cyclase/mutase family protein [Thermostilla marina]